MGKLIDTVALNRFKEKFIEKILDTDGKGIHFGTETDYPVETLPNSYPLGITLMYTSSTTSYPYAQGVVITIRPVANRCIQLSFANTPVVNYQLRNASSNAWSTWRGLKDMAGLTELQSAIGFVANGNKTTAAVNVDQFVMLKHSTISGCADGLYLAAKAIPANTAIDSTYLTAVTLGGLNTATNRLRIKKALYVTSDENSTIDLDLTDEYTVTSVRGYQSQNIVCMPYMLNGAWRARIVHANTGEPLASGSRSFIVTYMRAQ